MIKRPLFINLAKKLQELRKSAAAQAQAKRYQDTKNKKHKNSTIQQEEYMIN